MEILSAHNLLRRGNSQLSVGRTDY